MSLNRWMSLVGGSPVGPAPLLTTRCRSCGPLPHRCVAPWRRTAGTRESRPIAAPSTCITRSLAAEHRQWTRLADVRRRVGRARHGRSRTPVSAAARASADTGTLAQPRLHARSYVARPSTPHATAPPGTGTVIDDHNDPVNSEPRRHCLESLSTSPGTKVASGRTGT
jgi:hypothetical protein